MIYSHNKRSLATLRAIELGYDQRGPEWLIEFDVLPLKGDFAKQAGIFRRDPSAIIQHEGQYHCWYTKEDRQPKPLKVRPHDKAFPYQQAVVWHAISDDGITWSEQGAAIEVGEPGQYDDLAVSAPEVLVYEDRFYLVYQTTSTPCTQGQFVEIGLAWSDSPFGPWTKLSEPILSPQRVSEWLGEEDKRSLVKSKGSFDSHKVCDPCLMVFRDKFYLYYKGETMGEQMNMGGRETKHGVAIADKIFGPYVKSEYNPISNSGSELAIWLHNRGIASLITGEGPEKNTIQWAADGINFDIMSYIKGTPESLGIYRPPSDDQATLADPGLQWGLCHQYDLANKAYHLCRYQIRRQVLGKYQNRTKV
ncbi:glycoside hydrolase family 117 protein [Vibrio sp. WXL210]|uniref:glycoside hydrolase family 117 protein n=1 Tax=Vibrio sp. WXL210 TaxID=3450709 RepID=UPI003EC540FC